MHMLGALRMPREVRCIKHLDPDLQWDGVPGQVGLRTCMTIMRCSGVRSYVTTLSACAPSQIVASNAPLCSALCRLHTVLEVR